MMPIGKGSPMERSVRMGQTMMTTIAWHYRNPPVKCRMMALMSETISTCGRPDER